MPRKNDMMEKVNDNFGEITYFGQERYLGFCKGTMFFVLYCDGNDFARYYPIFYSMLEKCKKDGKVQCFLFPRFTDPLSFLMIFGGTFVILNIGQVPLPVSAFISFIWYLGVALFTFLVSKYTAKGKKKREALEQFIKNITRNHKNQ